MAKTKWRGYLSYKAKHTDIDSELKSSWVEVSSFAVRGGAKRLIDLSSTNDISLVSEFEQARSYKNISFLIPPPKGFEWHHLYEIAHHDLPLSMHFFASGNIGKTVTHQLTLLCKTAKITEQPVKGMDWGNSPILKVSMTLPETKLIHGSFQGGEFVEDEW